MRVPADHMFRDDDGSVIPPGQTVEVGAPQGAELVERGYELVGTRRLRRGGY
jgi:hypothetical protein